MTKTPYLVLFVILISVGLTSAYAINITLGGTVDITEILNMMGNRITNVGTPTDSTDATTKEYVDQEFPTDTLHINLVPCPPDMSQAGQWCIDNSVRGAKGIKDASLDCYDEGKIVTPLKALIACDYLDLSTSDCDAKTDPGDSAQLWTSDIAHKSSVGGDVFSDNVITYKNDNSVEEINSGGVSHEYFCSQIAPQNTWHKHSIIKNNDPVIVAVGDIACSPNSEYYNNGEGTTSPKNRCHQLLTSDLALSVNPDAVFLMGDLQYPNGTLADFLDSFDPTWGRLKSITYPSAGNHDYDSHDGAKGYFDYFGAVAGDRTKGWYSFDIGSWHIISLNSNCNPEGDGEDKNISCVNPPIKVGNEQIQWLENDLANNDSKCTLAFWHHPRFSSAENNAGNDDEVGPFWDKLYAAKADVVLVGHEHNYERFHPQDPNANPDLNGITQFIVGTGGWSLIDSDDNYVDNSAIYDDRTYGILKLVLHESSYDWEFIPQAGSTFTDQGTGVCN